MIMYKNRFRRQRNWQPGNVKKGIYKKRFQTFTIVSRCHPSGRKFHSTNGKGFFVSIKGAETGIYLTFNKH